jgi:hypothetical protein
MARITKFATDMHEAFDRTATPSNVDRALELIRSYQRDTRADFQVNVLEYAPAVARERECYNPPSNHDLLTTVLDDLLGTCGREYIGEVDGPPVEYLNVGDSYTPTLVWYRDTDRFRVQCYADAVEWCDRRGLLCD